MSLCNDLFIIFFIPGVPKKVERRIFSTLRAKSVMFFTALDRAYSAEENDTKIIKFGWVILILCPFLEIQSFSNFAGFLRPMREELCRDKPSICCFVEAHWSVATKETQINGLPQDIVWKVCPNTFLRSSVAKIQRNLKMNQNYPTKFNDLDIILFCRRCFI